MTERGVPLLALALAAAASSRLGLDDQAEGRLRISFTEAVAATDGADRAYRAAIEQTLPPQTARTMLSAMASFRELAQQTRESAVRDLEEIWQRSAQHYGWFDPLDAYAPPAYGLSHADATRAATIGDRARGQVQALRAQANESVLAQLTPEQVESLRAAKAQRHSRFRAALATAFKEAIPQPLDSSRFESTIDQLADLTEGWY